MTEPRHGMVPGSHERTHGPECFCGQPWIRMFGACYSQFPPTDPEPQPSDGPDYHADHAAWVRRNNPTDPDQPNGSE